MRDRQQANDRASDDDRRFHQLDSRRGRVGVGRREDDGDGVPNILDQEPASREGCPVDTKGVMLDSDKDGLVDCDDKEPYSPAGYPVDNQGVAKVPPPACCAELEKKAVQPVKPAAKPAGDCAETTLPSIAFEKDKYGMSSNNAVALQSIGERMQKCPDMKLVVTGYDESRNDHYLITERWKLQVIWKSDLAYPEIDLLYAII